MRRQCDAILLSLMFALAVSCSTAGGLQGRHDTDTIPDAVWKTEERFVFHERKHRETRRETDRIFRLWADHNRLGKNLTRFNVERISFGKDECRITYGYRLFDGRTGRVVITTDDFERTY